MAGRLDRPHPDPVDLLVVAKHEGMGPDIGKSVLPVEGFGACIALPNAKPEGSGSAPADFSIDFVHEDLGDTAAVPLFGDIQAPEFDGRVAGHARGCRPTPQLRITGKCSVDFGEECADVRVPEFSALLSYAIALGQVECHVLRVVLRGERIVKGARRELGQSGCIGRFTGSNGCGHRTP